MAGVPARFTAKDKERIYTWFAVGTLSLSVLILLLIAWLAQPGGIITSFNSIPLITLVAAAILSAVAGLFFLDASNPSAPDVFLPADRELLGKSIAAGNEPAITQYLRLRNMRGISGFFQKLGLPGLPLATIFVTLVFTILAVAVGEGTARTALFDLAKLTLGAFIGSFVQRQIDPSVRTDGKPIGQAPGGGAHGNLTGNVTVSGP